MTTVIHGRHLTRFDVAPDGESVAIHVLDEHAHTGTLVLPSDCLSALLMTLPEMVRRTLRQRFHDESMRVVYPVGNWKVEGSAIPGHVVVTLRTPDGFEVSFGLPAFDVLRMGTQAATASSDATGVVSN